MYVGTFMTSLDMAGFSLSICALDAERTAALDADTKVRPEAPRTALFCQHHARPMGHWHVRPSCAR